MSDTGNNDDKQSGGLYAPSAEGEVHTYDATDEKSSPRPMLLLGVLLLAAAFGGVLYIAYEQGMKESVRPPPPVLKAENSPAKTAPKQPGGMTIPHQDKTVYDQITGDSSEPPLEQLLPRAEEPMRIPPTEADGTSPSAPALAETETETVAPVAPVEEGIVADVEILPPAIELPLPEVAATPPAAPVMVEQSAAPSSETTTAIVEAVAPSAEETVLSAEAVVPPTEDPTSEPAAGTAPVVPARPDSPRPEPQVIETPETARGSHVVQIAAFRDQGVAETEFQTLQKKYPDLLGALSPDIQRADLGAKGIYYRLRVGPFSGKDPAGQLCSQLKTRGQECIVRRR